MTSKAPESLLDMLRKGHRFLLTSHINPDGDAIGSSLGMARLLHQLGKSATVWSRDPVPQVYSPLPGSERIHTGTEPPKGFPDLFDAAIIMECPTLDRTGLEEHLPSLPMINIDHHLGNALYGRVNWVDSSAPAAGEMVFRIAKALNLTLDEATANTLYLTLVTDTGGFRFSNATAQAFEAAAELVSSGAQPQTVSQWLHESKSEAAVRLLGEMLQTLKLHGEKGEESRPVATALLTRDMIERTGAAPGDSEGLIGHPRSIAGVEAVALLREIEGGWKASLRSKGKVSVEAVARSHGGGGHHNAAGFSVVSEDGKPVDGKALRAKIASTLLAGLAEKAQQDESKGSEEDQEND